MGRSDIAELEPKTRAALARIAQATPVEDRWADLAATLPGGGVSGSSSADGNVVNLDGRRPARLVVAVAAALVVLLGGLVALDRLRPGDPARPNSPSTRDPRFPPEPAHLLPAGDPSTMRVTPAGAADSISRTYFDDARARLIWMARSSGSAFANLDETGWATTSVGGIDVRTFSKVPDGNNQLAYQVARWERDGLEYGATLYPGGPADASAATSAGPRLVDLLATLVAATAEHPPAPPAGFYGPPLFDNLFSGVSINAPVHPDGELVLWSVPGEVTRSELDAVGQVLHEHPGVLGGLPQPTTVNGRPALFMAPDPAKGAENNTPALLFSPVDGTMAAISGGDSTTTDPAPLVTVAEGLHEVDDATWSFARYGGKLVASGSTNGADWSVAAPTDASCVVVIPLQVQDASAPPCAALRPDGPSVFVLSGSMLVVAPAAVASLAANTGQPNPKAIDIGPPQRFTAGGATWQLWSFTMPDGARNVTVTATGADGQPFGNPAYGSVLAS